ncbi:hypothetical protein [Nocardioides humi]|uniref:hypothetical protein n=1 Tax=Nocardioides humi TaxID=449461 RepID=UPI00112C40FF|nr:hypothetical protein [Nocardioides humi]
MLLTELRAEVLPGPACAGLGDGDRLSLVDLIRQGRIQSVLRCLEQLTSVVSAEPDNLLEENRIDHGARLSRAADGVP